VLRYQVKGMDEVAPETFGVDLDLIRQVGAIRELCQPIRFWSK